MRSFVIAAVLSAACAVNAVSITVNVSDASGGLLMYTNNSITAQKGDVVRFEFLGGNNSVTQSEGFSVPCTHMKGGFASGFRTGGQFEVKINDTKPIWYHCSQEGHCKAGMIGVINPPKNETVADALKVAQAPPASASSATPTPTESSSMVSSSSVEVVTSAVATSSAW